MPLAKFDNVVKLSEVLRLPVWLGNTDSFVEVEMSSLATKRPPVWEKVVKVVGAGGGGIRAEAVEASIDDVDEEAKVVILLVVEYSPGSKEGLAINFPRDVGLNKVPESEEILIGVVVDVDDTKKGGIGPFVMGVEMGEDISVVYVELVPTVVLVGAPETVAKVITFGISFPLEEALTKVRVGEEDDTNIEPVVATT